MTRADSPAVSIIIATCDRPALLLDCVASILANDFDDFEIVVIDQEPSRILEQLLTERFPCESRIRYLFVDRAGASRARNEGVRHARGRILVFADDDVEVDRGWLRAYIEAFAARPAPGLVQGRLSPRWPADQPAWLPEEKHYLLGLYDREGSLGPLPEGDGAITANCAVLREAVERLPELFDERVGPSYARGGLLTGEDTLLSVKVRQGGYAAVYQPAARAWHRISAAKLSPRTFLRRNFWDGVTLLTVNYLGGKVRPRNAAGTAVSQALAVVREAGRFLLARLRPTQPQARMRALAELAHRAGILWSALRLGLTGKLP